MKIKLISFYNRFNEYPTKYSLGTLRLAGYMAKNNNLDIDIVPIDSDIILDEEIIHRIVKGSPEVIGIPNFMWTEKLSQQISKRVKEYNPNIIRVVGGPSTASVDFADWQSDEIFVLGEGEEALLKICQEKIDNPNFDATQVRNLKLPNVFSEFENIQDRHVLYTESDIPRGLPLFSEEIEEMKQDKSKESFAWYETTRGCAYNCGYCGHKTRNNLGYIDLENVEQEIKNIKERGIQRLFIVDPIIGGTKENGKKVLKMCNEQIPDTKIIAYLRPEMLDDEFIDILSDCNLEEMRFGIQTLNPHVPGWVRSNSISIIERELGKLFGKNINWRAELIVGLPGDTLEGLKNSVRTVIDRFQPTVLAGYHLTAIKGTRLYNLVDGTDSENWLKVDEDSQVIESNSFSSEEFKEMARYSVITISLYNVLKKKYPQKIVNYDKLVRYIEKTIDEDIDYSRVENFDTDYMEQYWRNKLGELNMKRLIFIRHGESEGNQMRIIQGLVDNFGLTQKGREQIEAVTQEHLEEFSGVEKIVTSPYKRARETADVINQNIQNKPIEIDEKLIEFNPGILAGNTHEFNKQTYPEYYKIWQARGDLDGIPFAECGNELQARAIAFIMQYIDKENYNDLVVSHAGFLRCLINTIEGRERTTPINSSNGAVYIVDDILKNIKIEQRQRAMASKVYVVETADSNYVVKQKNREVNQEDRLEKSLLSRMQDANIKLPIVLYLANEKDGSIKVLEFVEGKHKYGRLEPDELRALTKQVRLIHGLLKQEPIDKYPQVDLYEDMKEKAEKAKNPYVLQTAQEILSDEKNIEKMRKSPKCLIHNDLNRDNVLFNRTPNGLEVNIIDWEGIAAFPEDYQLASFLASSILIEDGSMEQAMQIAHKFDPNVDEDYIKFLMKIRIFKGLHFFAEKRNEYTKSNPKVAREILKKYFLANEKINKYVPTEPINPKPQKYVDESQI